MAISRRSPNTIYLGGGEGPGGQGGYTLVNDLIAIEAITPGMALEYHNDSGTLKWGVQDLADDASSQLIVALEQIEMNLGVDDNYAAGDLVKAAIAHRGSTWWIIIPTGQNIAPGALLQYNGDGKFKALGTGTARMRALESSGGAVAADTRLRAEAL